ncbi:MarR family winged helix-turn-helix transcriptional regulator [Macromonas bipunctata]|uniref:MarR family winged helix-turn-helix transcriptional regulator n=1 Tax=Macromonas bipunctata TaxID=183670 RepID=UPI000C33E2D6|nr:MarR family transcriptional regulator [Macromonas bipunctata]
MSSAPDTAPVAQATVDINTQPGHAIRRLHQIAVGVFLHETHTHGITPVQYAALQVVHNQPGIDQRTLARTIAQDTSTTAGVVNRLELRGLLTRNTTPEDRRVRQLHLTPEGEQLLQGLVPDMLRAQELMLAPLTEQERPEFMRMLLRLITENNALSRAPGEVEA